MPNSMGSRLNPRQLEAVCAAEGPVLVLAGAGSGKTRVLTERIAYLVKEKGVSPRNVLAFTFTNKAAREMKERLEAAIPGVSETLWVGTFHSTGVKILRRHGKHIGIPRDFTIYDATDSLNLIKRVMSKHGLEGTILKSTYGLRETISRWKCELVTPEDALARASDNIEKKIALLYGAYEKELERAKALDFDDLIVRVVELFSSRPDVKDHYARRFLHVLVDEFQDTNPIQMVMIDALSSHTRNLFVVGDDDQSIYGWRGARVEHILNFESLYPSTRVIRLEQNYRSTKIILDAANHVISRNRGRKGKNLWTEGQRGEKIKILVSMDEEAEAVGVLSTVRELGAGGIALSEIAVLYRTNAQSRALEDAFKLGDVPYQIVGAVRFYERAEIRDVLAYCKLLVNPADQISLLRIINVPRRSIGKSTVDELERQALSRDIGVMELLRSGDYDLGSGPRKRCIEFVKLIEGLRSYAGSHRAPEVIEKIIEATDYRDHLRRNYPDAEARMENVEELVAAAQGFADASEDGSLAAFLEEIALVSDVDDLDEGRGAVTLMTLHNAKGLEFDCVIITGLEEGLFPHFNSMDSESGLEEERRLFYVGMTRARRLLYLSWANMRRRMGSVTGQAPSRFIGEIPEELLEGRVGVGLVDPYAPGRGRGTGSFDVHPDYEEISQEEVDYRVGIRVVHERFGTGIVRKVEGAGGNARIVVIFDDGTERKFLASYAPMRPLA